MTVKLQTFENEMKIEEEDETESIDLGINFDSRSKLYKKIGKSFLVIACVIALITIVLPTSLVGRIGFVSNGYLFRVLFGVFVFCLFICLIMIYYLGGGGENSLAWEDPEAGYLNFSFSNVIAVIGIVIEFVQICSFSFNERSKFLGSEQLRNSNYISVPFKSNTQSFEVVYWVMFSLAFVPYIFIVCVRLLLLFMSRRYGEETAGNFMNNHQQNIYSVLWVLVNALYLPILSSIFGGIDCTFYNVDTSTSDSSDFHSSSGATLDANNNVECLRGIHIPYIICSLIALVMYYPAASFAQSQTQNISDIKFKPRIVFIFAQGKVVLAAVAVFATNIIKAYLIVVLIVDIVFLVINIFLQPCIVDWVNRVRTVFLSFCLVTTICSFISFGMTTDAQRDSFDYKNNDDLPYVPLILMIIGWVGLSILFAVYYTLKEPILLYLRSKLKLNSSKPNRKPNANSNTNVNSP